MPAVILRAADFRRAAEEARATLHALDRTVPDPTEDFVALRRRRRLLADQVAFFEAAAKRLDRGCR